MGRYRPPWFFAATSVILILILAEGATAMFQDIAADRYTSVKPYATCTTYDMTFIRWYPDTFQPEILRYANASSFLATGAYDHELTVKNIPPAEGIRLTGLEPATRYHYTLISNTGESGDRSFLTFPAEGSCSFIIYGDTREQAPYFTQLERHRVVADRIAAEPGISFAINTGDLVSDTGDEDEWDRFFIAAGNLTGTTTYAAVRGNHDADQALFKNLFGTGMPYSFDCGDVHIAVLDSGSDASVPDADQARWLETDLASSDRWKIVLLHHPLYTSEPNHFGGFTNLQRMFEPVFLSGNVSVVFNAHVHAYERIEHAGITYLTEGRGGAPAYRLDDNGMEGSQRRQENSLGYSRITTDPVNGTMTIEVITIAEVSRDLRTVSRIYSEETVLERIVLVRPDRGSSIREIPDSAVQGLSLPFCGIGVAHSGRWNRSFFLAPFDFCP